MSCELYLDKIAKRDYSIQIDHNCEIFQVLWDEFGGRSSNFDLHYNKKIYNSYTNTFPKIFHYPGPTGHASELKKIINNRN